MQLKKQLELLMKEYGLNASKLSKVSGVATSTISDWLGGSNPKNIVQVKKVADCFEVSIDFLCFGISSSRGEINKYKDEINAGVFEVVLRRIKK